MQSYLMVGPMKPLTKNNVDSLEAITIILPFFSIYDQPSPSNA